MTDGTSQPRLRDRRISFKRHGIRTKEVYVDWAKRFSWFYVKRHPKQMGKDEQEAYLAYFAMKSPLDMA
jgi:hypothetical protein